MRKSAAMRLWKETAIRFLLNVLIVLFLLGFLLGLGWFVNGSFEMMPTEEQREKAKLGAVFVMFVTGLPCIVCTAARLRHRKVENPSQEKSCL